jgi:hypothetical protein
MKTEEIQETYPESEEGSYHLVAEERETIISWNEEDRDTIWIYSSQQPMIRRLLKNPLFECQRKAFNKAYKICPDPISVEGLLPRRALTIRTKLMKRELTEQQRKEFVERMKHGRETQKPHIG